MGTAGDVPAGGRQVRQLADKKAAWTAGWPATHLGKLLKGNGRLQRVVHAPVGQRKHLQAAVCKRSKRSPWVL